MQSLVEKDANNLKEEVIDARREVVKVKGQSLEDVKRSLVGGEMIPSHALDLGLIDGLETYDSFRASGRVKGYESKDNGLWIHRLFNSYRDLFNHVNRD